MPKLRHPTMSFNFNRPGEVFEVSDESVEYLIETYGCEVVDGPTPPPALPRPKPKPAVKDEPALNEPEKDIPDEPPPKPPSDPDNYAVKRKGGWYEYQGKSYRFADLPDSAIVLEE